MPGLHRRDSGFRACSGAEASDLVRPACDFSVQLWSACRGAAASRGHAAHACPITVLPGNGYHTDVSPLATPARSCWGLQAGSLAHLPGRGAVLVRRGPVRGSALPASHSRGSFPASPAPGFPQSGIVTSGPPPTCRHETYGVCRESGGAAGEGARPCSQKEAAPAHL